MSWAAAARRFGAGLLVTVPALLWSSASALAATEEFKSTGKEQQLKVPAGVTSVHVVAIGASGGSGGGLSGEGLVAPESPGGRGGIVSGDLAVKPEQVLYIEVGGLPVRGAGCISAACLGGFNGGGSSRAGGGGGGASDVRTVSIGAEPSPGNKASLESRLLVAAGGGGGGEACLVPPSHAAGGAGGDASAPGGNGGNCGTAGGEGGGAGKETEGGEGGKPSGKAGTLGTGGEGGLGTGGAGGAGLYGGGGGGDITLGESAEQQGAAGGGGGGSNLVPKGGTFGGTAKLGEAGSVTISYTLPPQTCGKTTIGKFSDQLLANLKRVNKCVVPFNALMSELTVYLAPTSHSGEQLIKGILYADAKGKPGELIAETGKLKFSSKGPAGWYHLAFLTPVRLSAGTYWIGIITGASSQVAGERFDSVSKAEDFNANSYIAGASKSFGSFKTTNEEMSLYATFEEEPKRCAPVFGLTIC
jgi:hypothetical protein